MADPLTVTEVRDECADDAEELLTAWLNPLATERNGAVGVARMGTDPLPFYLVTVVTGNENLEMGTADPVFDVDVLCSKTLGYTAAKTESRLVHRRILLLGQYSEAIVLKSGRVAGIDDLEVREIPRWENYEDVSILRKVGRYKVGLSYVPQ